MSSTGVDPEKVIHRLAQTIGGLHAEIAMRDTALEQAQARAAELEQALAAKDAELARAHQAAEQRQQPEPATPQTTG